MLKKWDTTRRIKRQGEETYQALSYKKRKALLARVAFQTFSKKKFFVPRRKLEQLIGAYIKNLPEVKEKKIDVESREVLKSITAQHGLIVPRAKGIYSFSHLSFQEYFTAHYLVSSRESKKIIKKAIKANILNPLWQEVFLHTVGMLDEADDFIKALKQYIDSYAIKHNINFFLSQIDNLIKPNSFLNLHGGEGRTLTLYFVIALDLNLNLECKRNKVRELPYSNFLGRATALDRTLARILDLSLILNLDRSIVHDLAKILAPLFIFDQDHIFDLDINRPLDHSKAMNFSSNLHFDLDRSLTLAFDHTFDHSKEFEINSIVTLTTYLELNIFLLNCLDIDAYISNDIRDKILNELLFVQKR